MNTLYPDVVVPSVDKLTPEWLRERKILGLILDIDNTLSAYGCERPETHTVEFLARMRRAGIKLAVLSNGAHARVQTYLAGEEIPYFSKAKKPLSKGFSWAVRELGLPAERIAVVGDQIFTDVLGGNRAGCFTILTEPFDENEFWFVKVKRLFERRFRRVRNG